QGRVAAIGPCTTSIPVGAQCGGGQVYQECSSPCGRTCADLRLDGTSSCPGLDDVCVSGCNCPGGLVLDDSGQCVP
ncbi:SSPO protein, partial [Penelope pileata]|nr:SSPO protein [Penelope pileata]